MDGMSGALAFESVINATAAGTTDITSAAVDMQGYEGAIFILKVGTLTATQTTKVKAQQSNDSGGSPDDFTDLAGSLSAAFADADSNKLLIHEVIRPRKRFLKWVVDRGVANAVLDSGVVVKYKAHARPTTQPATVAVSKVVVSPAEGTA